MDTDRSSGALPFRSWWSRLGLRKKPARRVPQEPALRAELLSADDMQLYGARLAGQHRLSTRTSADPLLPRLADNEAALSSAYEALTTAAREDRRITPAAEWLLDNTYLITEQIHIATSHLPKGYSQSLPRLANGPSAGLPRVYSIALETISHGDGRVDTEGLARFIAAYQSITPLKLGELWAIPIMLRLSLIENLRRVASRVMTDLADRNLAERWADRMTQAAERDPKSLVLVVADMARSDPPMGSSFVAELARRLQGQGAALTLPLTWLEQVLLESASSVGRMVQIEAQQQAADQVSISNSIVSLRLLSSTDWRDFVEDTSIVEHILRKDPDGVYAQMDFATRDHYRHGVERLARRSRFTEEVVAQAAIDLALAEAPGERGRHVGFYLMHEGLRALERRIKAGPTLAEQFRRGMLRIPLTSYLGLSVLVMGALALPFLDRVRDQHWPGWALGLLAATALLMTSRTAIDLVNWLVTQTVRPDWLPRMDYADGIPVHATTLVVVPSLIGSAADVDELVEGLQVRYLGNRDPHLHFALLTDFMDAPVETLDGDAALLAHARAAMEALNARYPESGGNRFFLLHRPRRWNAADGLWMGFERKRGKIAELNALLRGAGQGCFSLVVGDLAALPRVRYVITLDADTQLPRDAAQRFVGAIGHPLNAAVYDAAKQRVTSGYAILQPRVGTSLTSTARSRYARWFGGDAGIDPYTRAVSDVYQDLFGEGSFVGKGIYDVDAFERAVEGRFAENRVLSHDLVEGCYARSGLLSDVYLFEEYPARYSADVNRRHRWIRGDWQLLPWIFHWVRSPAGKLERNPLSRLSRWKLFDNLRRSLAPGAWLAMLLIGWLATSTPVAWTLIIVAMLVGLPLLAGAIDLLRKPHDMPLRRHVALVSGGLARHLVRIALEMVWLPHEVRYHVDAIARTGWRMAISRRNLLQWNASREVDRVAAAGLVAHYRNMWAGPVLALVLLVALPRIGSAMWPALVFIMAWLVSPAVAWRISRPPSVAPARLTVDDLRFLRALARRTWAFFDRYVGADDHWLPPDNVQEQPAPRVAHRTSPTNLGMGLLAHLSAFDLGYLSAERMLDRIGMTLASMNKLERHRGHLLNWYDTQTLMPLLPRYVSTVDSGNLAGHLVTLQRGLLMLADAPVRGGCPYQGLLDTLDVLRDAALVGSTQKLEYAPLQRELEAAAALPVWAQGAATLRRILDLALTLDRHEATPDGDIAYWTTAFIDQCRDGLDELTRFELPPQGDLLASAASLRQLAMIDEVAWPAAAAVTRLAAARLARIEHLAEIIGDFATMEFGFLYDARRHLLAIGYAVDERRLDGGFYDLLASEARLTNFVAIAQGQLPQVSWFSLGRLLTSTGGVPVLLSWTGSMFEYLMPMLVMPNYEGTLLDQTCRAVVKRQIEYGHQLGLPWGISESGYNVLDAQLNYQYRAFGVPGLGLKRGLGEDIVVAPYASALALMVAPEAACRNLQRLTAMGAAGRYGMFEAIDYTQTRVPRGQNSAIIQSFMAHHQGMSLLSLSSVLLDQPMQKRFESEPQFKATTLLLQERLPKTATEYLPTPSAVSVDASALAAQNKLRIVTDPNQSRPSVQLLSNGRYHVMVSSAGGGYSRWNDLAVTRWHEDITTDGAGMFCYLRDVGTGEFWSAAHQPTLKRTDLFEAIFSDARAEFRVRASDFDAHTEIVVSPEDDIELRRMRVTNRARVRRTIELTSYGEVVLAPPIADQMHPAFSKLFVQTELLESLQAILCTRRSSGGTQTPPWMCHLLAVHGADIEAISYETDRARFIGRGRSLAFPAAMDADDGDAGRLSNSAGSVLDPIVSIRCRIELEPGQTATIDFVTGMSESRDGCLNLINKYRDRHLADRVFDLAWTHSQVSLRQINATPADVRLYEQMAASIVYANSLLRTDQSVMMANRRNQSGLWGQSISGDLPIVLVQIADLDNIELVRQMVQAHAYWRLKGLPVDLVIWNEDHAGYRQNLHDLIMGLIASGATASLLDRPGGIFVKPAQLLSKDDRELMLAVARVIVADTRGTLAEQIGRRRSEAVIPKLETTRVRTPLAITRLPDALPGLMLQNAYGGFTADGTEYVVTLAEGQTTPAPWVNVLANPTFGTVVSESGGAYTWGENAHEFRLTPWVNDPVGDASGEALYLRDEESGHYWSPTPLPRRGAGIYRIRHGFGYSVFEHAEDGMLSELSIYVALDAPIKYMVLKVSNRSGRARKLSATGYVEWVLGDLRAKSAMHIVTELDPLTGALMARNPYSMEFGGRSVFFDVDRPTSSFSGDRGEFIGRNGSLRAPAGMRNAWLSGRVGAGLDPCAALRTEFDLGDGDSQELVFRMGTGSDAAEAGAWARQARGPEAAAAVLAAVRDHWRDTLGRVRITTPEPAVDVLVNGWLMYQIIACRFWARSGFYQSGGAFGFRDQLQDSMAMVHATPHLTRAHLLQCAARQFPQGDVQHWWHPPLGRGVRTQCSDDYLWLAAAASRYVQVTGDASVLDEPVGFLEGRGLNPGEESYYNLPDRSALVETLYEHCKRALRHGLTKGVHGLPLIGSGDWNDGMNRVGEQGRGESIWLGFFLYDVLSTFEVTARERGDLAFATECANEAATLRTQLAEHGWDGAWYRRAYFDDGTPLGSSANEECKIDSIAQSWSVLSGAGSAERQRQAMESLDRHLVDVDAGVIRLLDPPFDTSAVDPGYIKGYVPGVRENGGQYTHAAVWATMAFAELGDTEHAWDLLRMINPVKPGQDAAATDRYKVEPYVMAADVYGRQPHRGRGGWTWYTGSAGWMYRLMVESLLGLQVRGDRLRVDARLPRSWDGFELDYRHASATYRMRVTRTGAAGDATRVTVDGVVQVDQTVVMVDDGREHDVEVDLPARP